MATETEIDASALDALDISPEDCRRWLVELYKEAAAARAKNETEQWRKLCLLASLLESITEVFEEGAKTRVPIQSFTREFN